MAGFRERLQQRAREAGSWLCLGLDPEPSAFPSGLRAADTASWCLQVLEAAGAVACAVKPNAAFFEALGRPGQEALEATCAWARAHRLPLILDGKRNDIGSTARKYAEAAFDVLGADAVTVTPYLGRDTVEPFARYGDRGVFLLARTSNPSAGDFQDLQVAPGLPLYEAVARQAMAWDREFGNLGLVAGATYPEELARLRTVCGDGVPLLIPGVGAQGASAGETLARGADSAGEFAVVNVGRAILQAGAGDAWPEAVQAAARRFAAQLPAAARTPK